MKKTGLVKEEEHNRAKWLKVLKTMAIRNPTNSVDEKTDQN